MPTDADDALRSRLAAAFPVGVVSCDPVDRVLLGTDGSKIRGDAFAVVKPTDEDHVRTAILFAGANGLSVVPRGAGTSPTGSATARRRQIVLDFSRMNRILDVSPRDMVAVVEPGVMCGELQSRAEAVGMFYPPDPASARTSTLGGNVATCAGGLRAAKYGVTRDYVLGLRCVGADGRVFETGGRSLKSVVGYDLTRLLTGSEGTLAVFTRLTLRLLPKPPHAATLLAEFADDEGGFSAADAILAAGVLPRALEYMDRDVLGIVADDPTPRSGSSLLIEVDGSPADCRDQAERVAAAVRSIGALSVRIADAGDDRDALWAARRSISSAVYRVFGAKRSEDLGVPRGRLAEAVAAIKAASRACGARCVVYGHAGDANLHFNFPYDPTVDGAKSAVDAAVDAAMAVALRFGGTVSGEHGIGLKKIDQVRRETDARALELMQHVKRAFDPAGILNPGKAIPE